MQRATGSLPSKQLKSREETGKYLRTSDSVGVNNTEVTRADSPWASGRTDK